MEGRNYEMKEQVPVKKEGQEKAQMKLLREQVEALSLWLGKSIANLQMNEVKVIELNYQVNKKESEMQGFVQVLKNKDS